MGRHSCLLAMALFLTGCTPEPWMNLFVNLENIFPAHTIEAPASPDPLEPSETPIELPQFFVHNCIPINLDWFLAASGTGGLLVVQDGQIVFERYSLGTDSETRFTSWSVAKSFTSALTGLAIQDGYVGSVHDLASDYVPELLETAFHDVSIKDLLQMSSGVHFVEDYLSPDDDSLKLLLSLFGSLDAYVATMQTKDHPTGTYNDYRSIDTQVLAMVLKRATGQSLSSYLEDKLWKPLGAERDAVWLVDADGMEAAFCCMGVVLRDYARLGLLFLRGGTWRNQQILPSAWVEASIDTSEPHLRPGPNPQSSDTWGYGYQWWVPDEQGDYLAIGVFNQFIYINPLKDLVIVKTSANPTYFLDYAEEAHLSLFRAISALF